MVEHNIRIIAKNYTQVSLKRMAKILDLKETETEKFLNKMVDNKTVAAKIDRLDNIVSFTKYQDPNKVCISLHMYITVDQKFIIFLNIW